MNRRFFKYRPVRTASQLSFVREVIVEGKLYLARPLHFSDPLDAVTSHFTDGDVPAVLSLTEHGDSRLLWAYYGGWFRGVMIELELSLTTAPFDGLQKVSYIADDADLFERIANRDLFAKAHEFAHEGEWRLPYIGGESHLSLPLNSVKSVTLGPALLPDFREAITQMCASANVGVQEYRPKLVGSGDRAR